MYKNWLILSVFFCFLTVSLQGQDTWCEDYEEWRNGRTITWSKSETSGITSFRIRDGFADDDLQYLNGFMEDWEDGILEQYHYTVTENGGDLNTYISLEFLNDSLFSYSSGESHFMSGMLGYAFSANNKIIDIGNRKVLELHDMLDCDENEEGCIEILLRLLMELHRENEYGKDLFNFTGLWSFPTYYIMEKGLNISTGRFGHDYYLIPYEILEPYLRPSMRKKWKTSKNNE